MRKLSLLALIASAFAQRVDYNLLEPIGADEYHDRRARLLEVMPERCVFLLPAPPPSGELTPYRTSSDLFYLTGLTQPDVVLLLFNGPTPREILFMPGRDPQRERWEGVKIGPGEESARLLGVASTEDTKRLLPVLEEILGEASTVAGCAAARGAAPDPLESLRETYPEAVAAIEKRGAMNVLNLAGALAGFRLIKSPREVDFLRRAIKLSGQGLVDAMRGAEPGMAEFHLEALIEFAFFRGGAERTGFPSIVGSGPNSCILHYNANRRIMAKGDLVVCDVGAEYGMYTADVTRTFPVNGHFSSRQREIYEIVMRAQQAAFDAVRPGSTVREVHKAAKKVIAEAGYSEYFIHGTSHWLGLDVHDVGNYATPLAPGMVLTVEPGIYLPEENLGIRIEDDVLVVEDGRVVLSGAIPRSADAIEGVMVSGLRRD